MQQKSNLKLFVILVINYFTAEQAWQDVGRISFELSQAKDVAQEATSKNCQLQAVIYFSYIQGTW